MAVTNMHTGRKTVQMHFCLPSPSSPSGMESIVLTYLLSVVCNYSAYQFSIKIQLWTNGKPEWLKHEQNKNVTPSPRPQFLPSFRFPRLKRKTRWNGSRTSNNCSHFVMKYVPDFVHKQNMLWYLSTYCLHMHFFSPKKMSPYLLWIMNGHLCER